MRLSDAIERGATILQTRGPSFEAGDCTVAMAAGVLGRLPTQAEANAHYWSQHSFDGLVVNPCEALELWMRYAVLHRYRWADVISKLRGYGQ